MTPRRSTHQAAHRHRVTVLNAICSELHKMATLRASVITLLAFIPVSLVFVGMDAVGNSFITQDAAANLPVLTTTLTLAVPVGQLLAIIVSVLSISGEYSTGQIGSTLVAVPRRMHVLVAKAVSVAVCVWVVGLVGVLASAAIAVPAIIAVGPLPPAGQVMSSILMTAAGAATGMASIALIALCIGGVLRSVAFSISAAFGLILVLPGLMSLAPVPLLRTLSLYTPTTAADALSSAVPRIAPELGLVVLLGSVLVGGVVWGVALVRRDA